MPEATLLSSVASAHLLGITGEVASSEGGPMQTTMAMLFDGIKERYACEKGVCYVADMPVSSVGCHPSSICGSAEEFGALHVVSSEETLRGMRDAPQSHGTILVSPVRPPHVSLYALHIVTADPIEEVASAIEVVLYRYRLWFHDVANAVLTGASLDALVEHAHSLLGNPIIVLDRALRVAARTKSDTMNDDMWNPLDHHSEMFMKPMEAPGFAEFLSIMSQAHAVSDFRMFNGVQLAACRTYEIEGDFLVVCLVQKNRPITDGDWGLLAFVAEMVGIVAKTSVSLGEEEIGLNGLLIDGFTGRITNPIELANRFGAVGLKIKEFNRIIVVTALTGSLNERRVHRLIKDIKVNYPIDHGLVFNGDLVLFSTYEDKHGMNGSDYRKFERFLAQQGLVAGVSEESPSPIQLQEMYQCACYAVRIGQKAFPDTPLVFFDDCRDRYLAEICAEEGNPDLFMHPAIAKLRALQGTGKAPLSDVLRSLARNWGNRTQTARDLYIQRNTLRTRIREIESFCGVDLSDAKEISHIRRSYALEAYVLKSGDGF